MDDCHFIRVVAAIIIKGNSVLLSKRVEGKHKAGYWEFPGGKIDEGETGIVALSREIKEELNLSIRNPQLFETIEFTYPEKRVFIAFYLVNEFSGVPCGMEQQEVRWIDRVELYQYKLPEANEPVLQKLLNQWNSLDFN